MGTTRLIRSLHEPDISVLRPAVVGPLFGIAVSESLLFFGYTSLSLWGHLLTLLACTLAPLRLDAGHATLAAFALVPLFRLVNLGMPTFFELTVYWLPLIYGPLLPAVVLVARSEEAVDLRPGMRALVLGLPVVVPAAWVLAELEYALIRPDRLIPTLSAGHLVLITVVMVGFVGLVEELLFRGVLQRTLEDRLGRWTGLLLTSVVFGLMHSGYGIPLEMVFAGGIGLVFGLVYDYTDSLALVSVFHGAVNVFLFALVPEYGLILVQRLAG